MLIVPDRGPTTGETTVEITSADFVEGTTVTFGGQSATDVTIIDETTLTCITPAHDEGGVTVVLAIPADPVQALANGFTYIKKHKPLILHMGPELLVHGPAPSTVKTSVTTDPTDPIGAVYEWTQISGPVSVTIGSPAALNTTLTFTTYATGFYTFRLTALWDEMSTAGQVVAFVPPTHAPRITMPANTVIAP
jgi:hypothetical protein